MQIFSKILNESEYQNENLNLDSLKGGVKLRYVEGQKKSVFEFLQKMTLLPLILCEKSIARIPEA